PFTRVPAEKPRSNEGSRMSLLAPLFLAGLLAIGLPLWLHRLSSDNPNKQRFSSLMFLEPGEPRRVLAKKLQYLLLLALRIGVLALLALAFAQPAIWRVPQAGGQTGARLHVIALDGSASMGYGDRWQRALAAAGDVLGSLGSGDRAQLVQVGRTLEVLGAPTGDVAALRQALNTAKPGSFRVDYGQLMRSLDGVLRTAELPVVLDLVSDMQASGMPARFGELAPRRPAEIVLHDVATGSAANWAVDGFAGSALTGELTASVRSFAAAAATKTLTLTQNGRAVGTQTVEVPAGGRAQVKFPPLELSSGPNRVEVTLSPADDLPADDKRYLALKRPEPRSVLIVAADTRGRGALFTSAALETLAALQLKPEIKAPAALGEKPLGGYSFVVVTDLGLLGASESALLKDYVEHGGKVLLAAGPRSAGLTTLPVTGERLAATAQMSADRNASIGDVDSTHPALRGVEDLRSARFARALTVEPAVEDRVLVRLADSTPLLLERSLGAGRVLLFTSSLDREWNDLPVQPVFVPLMAGLANHLLGGAGFSSEADLGSTLAVRALGLAGGQIFDPRGQKALGLGAGSDDVLLDQLGFYEVVGGGATEIVAVNFDPRESDLAPIEPGILERWKGLGVRAADQTQRAAPVGAQPVASPLGPWLVILLVLLVIVETAVGNWHLRVRRGIAA
ncbi:MAG TPA: BatA domain-containing protein, partial [Gammaproteobacteria bacterium]|nr:BatA domain-containing protein [Gammaproteobacteria bacterium]